MQFWMRYLSEIFWTYSWDVPTLVPIISKLLVCLSVCQLAYFLTGITPIFGYLQFWIRCISEFFQRHSLDVGTLFPNNSEFLICLSVCQLAYFLTDIRQIQGYLKFCMIYLSEFFWRHSWDVGTLFPNNSELLVCRSVYHLSHIPSST